VEKEEVDYRPRYAPKGIDVTKTKEPEVLISLLSMNELNERIDIVMCYVEHSRVLYIVELDFEEPFHDDDDTGGKQAHVDSDLEFDVEGDES
ncbi:hypothetical protein HAX54_039956, partial [Datura stramonium]|nr:hypothetical protein [Datura stramonium]